MSKRLIIIPTSSVQYLAEKIKKKRDNFRIIFPTENKDGKRCFPCHRLEILINFTQLLYLEEIRQFRYSRLFLILELIP